MSTTTIRDRLKQVREALHSARDDRATALKERDAAREAFASADGAMTHAEMLEHPDFKAAEEAVRKVGQLDDAIADLQKAEASILGMLGDTQLNPQVDPARLEEVARGVWDGDALLRAEDSPYRKHQLGGTFSSTSKFESVSLGQIAGREDFREFLAADPIGSANKQGGVPSDRRGIVQPLLKPLSLLDLIPVGATDSNLIEYVQVTAIPTGAMETAELTAKPSLGLGTVDATAPVRTIAGYVKLARQALDDVSGLATLINTLLPYEVRRRIEAQILNGDGAGQNLRGILQTTGIGAPAAVTGDNAADAILRALTVCVLSDSDPNFVTLNPLGWQKLMLMRENDTDRTGQYLYGSPGQIAAPTIWGLALTANRVVPQTTALVGDANGATLLVREGVNVKVSDSDTDDFTNNRVTVLAEGRVAFPVWRPASFAKATIPA